MPPAVSLIVTARNEGPAIAACLRSLAAQQGAGEFEIILVDDRSTDGTAAIARNLELENFTLLRIDHFDHATLTARQIALDQAIRAARGEIVFLTDADAVVRPDWVASMLECLSGDAVAAPVVFIKHPEGGSRWIALLQTVDSAFYTGVCAVLNACGLSSGFVFGNCAFRRECYEKTGGFETIGFALTEDLAFARALRKAGCRVSFTAHPGVAVKACRNLSELVQRAQRIGAGGFSALSCFLGLWMLAWIALGLGAMLDPGLFIVPFLIRHALGSGFISWWLARGGRARLIPVTLVYEPLAVVIGLTVLWCGRRQSKVVWGGLDYGR